jgi:hypothetical protein
MPRMGARASSERGRLLLRSSARAQSRDAICAADVLARARKQLCARQRDAPRGGPARTRLSGAGLLLLLLLLRGGALQVALLALCSGALQVPLLRLRGRACAQGAKRCASERDASARGASERAAPAAGGAESHERSQKAAMATCRATTAHAASLSGADGARAAAHAHARTRRRVARAHPTRPACPTTWL